MKIKKPFTGEGIASLIVCGLIIGTTVGLFIVSRINQKLPLSIGDRVGFTIFLAFLGGEIGNLLGTGHFRSRRREIIFSEFIEKFAYDGREAKSVNNVLMDEAAAIQSLIDSLDLLKLKGLETLEGTSGLTADQKADRYIKLKRNLEVQINNLIEEWNYRYDLAYEVKQMGLITYGFGGRNYRRYLPENKEQVAS